MKVTCAKKYFAASNGKDGFVNYFPQIFNKEACKKLYVIKGGPGTGKSRFMREVAEAAEERGMVARRYYCSSDSDSLDGVLIEDMAVGLIDGTAPHVCEPSAPGAFEQIINLGEFWNEKTLEENKKEIEYLAGLKSSAYSEAYAMLSAYGALLEAEEMILSRYVNRKKLSGAVKRLLHKLPVSERPRFEPALCRAVGMNGKTKLDSYENEGGALFTLPDKHRLAHFVLGEIAREAKRLGMSCRVSYDPVMYGRVDAVSLCDAGLVFVTGDGGERVINPKRFINESALKTEKDKLKRIENALEITDELVLDSFKAVKEYHFALEEIYASAMDFSAKEAFTENFIKKLF